MRIIRTHSAPQLMSALLIMALAFAVAACGRKGAPEPPPGADYPRTYPSR